MFYRYVFFVRDYKEKKLITIIENFEKTIFMNLRIKEGIEGLILGLMFLFISFIFFMSAFSNGRRFLEKKKLFFYVKKEGVSWSTRYPILWSIFCLMVSIISLFWGLGGFFGGILLILGKISISGK